jgi:hypothetical protein
MDTEAQGQPPDRVRASRAGPQRHLSFEHPSAPFLGAKRTSVENLFGNEAQGSIELQLGGNA